MTKKSNILIVSSALLMIAALGVFLIFKNYPLPMSCSRAIKVGQATQIWQENQDVVRDLERIYAADTGFSISLDSTKCEGKAFIHITYDTSKTKSFIHDKLQETPLRAIPVEWQNV